MTYPHKDTTHDIPIIPIHITYHTYNQMSIGYTHLKRRREWIWWYFMIFQDMSYAAIQKWDHQGICPVWTEQMLWWWRGAFSSPRGFQRSILRIPEILTYSFSTRKIVGDDSWQKIVSWRIWTFSHTGRCLLSGLRLLPASLLLRRWRVRRTSGFRLACQH